MKQRRRLGFLGAVMAVSLAGTPAAASSPTTPVPAPPIPETVASPASQPLLDICLTEGGQEKPAQLPLPEVERLLSTTRAYQGPCAEYGDSTDFFGPGRVTAFTQSYPDGRPYAMGVAKTSQTLDNLPHHPANNPLYCYDKNGDGTEDPNTECSGGYEKMLRLPERFVKDPKNPHHFALVNWNPHGHVPQHVFDKPHFDMHFYTKAMADKQRLAIKPGPCPVLVDCGQYPLGKNLPDKKYLPWQNKDTDALEPAMGNHLVDTTRPEFHGGEFTHSPIWGTWDGKVIFHEAMVTHKIYSDLRAGVILNNSCHSLNQPQGNAYQVAGWYPTQYCLEHRPNRGEVVTTLKDFHWREAS